MHSLQLSQPSASVEAGMVDVAGGPVVDTIVSNVVVTCTGGASVVDSIVVGGAAVIVVGTSGGAIVTSTVVGIDSAQRQRPPILQGHHV